MLLTSSQQRLFSLLAGLLFLYACYLFIVADLGQSSLLVKQLRHLPYGDKVGHFFLYGTLTVLVNLAFAGRRIKLGVRRLLLGSVMVFIFAITEELTQLVIPYRSFDILDITCDLAGIILGSYWLTSRDHLNPLSASPVPDTTQTE